MDSKEVIKESLEICTKITSISQETKCNQQKCKTLAERITVVLGVVSKIDPLPSAGSLSQLNTLFRDALQLIQSNDANHYLAHAIQKNTAQIEFQTVQQRLYKLVKSSKWKVPTEKLINEQKDIQDEDQDRNNLKDLFNKLEQDHTLLKDQLEVQAVVLPFDKALNTIKSQLEKLNSGKHAEISATELRLIQKIGAGSYGEVWKASWQGKFVAVKMLLPQDINDSLVQDFKEELEVVSQLNHPNISRVYGASTINRNQLAVIFEFYPNNLYKLIHADKKSLDLPTKFKLALGIAKGIEYLHEKNLLHKDLKSDNILLDAELNPRISDVGMTKVKSQSSRSKPASAWMGPELFEMKPNLTLKLDIYSFGILLWEIMTEQFPFEVYKDPNQIALAIRDGERPEIPSSFPQELVGLLTACWAANPEKRPTIQEVVKTLKGLQPKTDVPKMAAVGNTDTTPEPKKKKKNQEEPSKPPPESSVTERGEKEKSDQTKEATTTAENPKTEDTKQTATDEKKKTTKKKSKAKTESQSKAEQVKVEPAKETEPGKEIASEPEPKTSEKSDPKGKKDKPEKSASGKEKKDGGCCIIM